MASFSHCVAAHRAQSGMDALHTHYRANPILTFSLSCSSAAEDCALTQLGEAQDSGIPCTAKACWPYPQPPQSTGPLSPSLPSPLSLHLTLHLSLLLILSLSTSLFISLSTSLHSSLSPYPSLSSLSISPFISLSLSPFLSFSISLSIHLTFHISLAFSPHSPFLHLSHTLNNSSLCPLSLFISISLTATTSLCSNCSKLV